MKQIPEGKMLSELPLNEKPFGKMVKFFHYDKGWMLQLAECTETTVHYTNKYILQILLKILFNNVLDTSYHIFRRLKEKFVI